jgi:predicted cupin superfamily sugar epimerase
VIDLRDPGLPAGRVIAALGLLPHPEGGCFRETWRDAPEDGARGAGTAILFLLETGQRSAWHRVDADELWLWHAGAPLALHIDAATLMIGPDLAAGEHLQALVPRGTWQAAHSTGAWSLMACVVAPAFSFAGFEMAPPDWEPPGRGARDNAGRDG